MKIYNRPQTTTIQSNPYHTRFRGLPKVEAEILQKTAQHSVQEKGIYSRLKTLIAGSFLAGLFGLSATKNNKTSETAPTQQAKNEEPKNVEEQKTIQETSTDKIQSDMIL